MMEGMKKKRGLGTVATETMGRVMLSAMLVAHGVKDEETLQLTFNGDGLARGVMAISDGACNVRAWIGNPELDAELKDPATGRSNVRGAVGRGTLQVVKVRLLIRSFWSSQVQPASQLTRRSLAPSTEPPDVAHPLQRRGGDRVGGGGARCGVLPRELGAAQHGHRRGAAPGPGLGHGCVTMRRVSACVRCVDGGPLTPLPNPQSTVESAGGFYIEMMPGVEEDSIVQVEANLADLKEKYGSLDPGQLFSGQKPLTPYKLVKELLYGLGVSTATETFPQYKCTCSSEKVFRALKVCWCRVRLGDGGTRRASGTHLFSHTVTCTDSVGGGDR